VLRFKISHGLRPGSRSRILKGGTNNQADCRGMSLIELLIVFCMIGIIAAAALPQLIASRRLVRSAAIPRQILAEMRLARQRAITQQQAFTVQYDDVNKQIIVINHQASGAALFDDPNYPNTAGSISDHVIALSGSGISPAEIVYDIPASLPATAQGSLDDGVARTKLTNNQVSVTFQPSGSVIDRNGNPANKALFLYNSNDPDNTACAVSILGAAGRVKTWTYSSSANKYVE
jgi:prepilin-type N-terminal cleavage/methylation domain-containing protein